MKKAKIMLLSLTLFAALGAALAFKAKTGNANWCYTIRELDPQLPSTNFCTIFEAEKKTAGPVVIYATSLYNNNVPVAVEEDCLDPDKIKTCIPQPTLVGD